MNDSSDGSATNLIVDKVHMFEGLPLVAVTVIGIANPTSLPDFSSSSIRWRTASRVVAAAEEESGRLVQAREGEGQRPVRPLATCEGRLFRMNLARAMCMMMLDESY